jgi:hypothetical protein
MPIKNDTKEMNEEKENDQFEETQDLAVQPIVTFGKDLIVTIYKRKNNYDLKKNRSPN